MMEFSAALVLGGAIVYLVSRDNGALMITAGCGLALMKWLAPIIGLKRRKE